MADPIKGETKRGTKAAAANTQSPAKKGAVKKAAAQKSVTKKAVTNRAVTKKAAVSKKATTKGSTVKAAARRPARKKQAAAKLQINPKERYEMIAKMAYFRAEKRGFAPGGEHEDWLHSELLVDEMLRSRKD